MHNTRCHPSFPSGRTHAMTNDQTEGVRPECFTVHNLNAPEIDFDGGLIEQTIASPLAISFLYFKKVDVPQALLQDSKWAFPSSQVCIHEGEDGVLGRGSYGEVRVATWRGLRVAVKQLHALNNAQRASMSVEQAAEAHRDLLKEMSLLASLRHPNLLLFLGVTYDEGTNNPRSIITELMPSSIYELLETRGLVLELSEVIDLASDICAGLAYLHGHSPAIVHRDLSSRNVLYDGRTAKLADLGQAKALGLGASGSGSRQTSMPGAMVYAAPEVLTGRYTSSIDLFSFGVLLAQLITGEYPRIDMRKEQMADAGVRFPVLKPLLERCLSLHAEDRPSASETMRALEGHRADPCTYHVAGHGAGVLAERWFQTEQKERCRALEARLHVHERRLSAELRRWKEEADRADKMSGRIKAAERERDRAVIRREEIEESLAGALTALEEERDAHGATRKGLHEARDGNGLLEGTVARLEKDLQRSQRAVTSAETLQNFAVENNALANRVAEEAKKASEVAKERAAQAEAQLAGQVAEAHEVEARLKQAISRWEGEKIERLRFKKDFFAKCTEAQEHERMARDLRRSLKDATDRLSNYDGLPESQQIQQRMIDLEADRKRARDEMVEREKDLEERNKDIEALTDKLRMVEEDRDRVRQQHAEQEEEVKSLMKARSEAEKTSKRAARYLAKARERIKEGKEENALLKEDIVVTRNEMKRVEKDAPWLFRGRGRGQSSHGGYSDGDSSSDQRIANSAIADGAVTRGERNGSDTGSSSSSESEDDSRVEDLVNEALALGPREVAQLLQRHPKRREFQHRGLRALRNLAYQGDEERASVAAAGGIAAVIQAMKHFPDDLKIQIVGIKTIAHLAFGSDANRIEVGSCGGTEAITRAMAAFPADPVLQGEACTALTNLSHNCDQNRRLMVEAGGLILVLDAMQAFPGDPKLQRQACWVLLTLAANDEISRLIATEGGVGAIIAAMINNADDTGVQHFGCWALANVGWGQADVQKFAKEEGALEAIQTALRRFPAHQALANKARLASDVISKGAGVL